MPDEMQSTDLTPPRPESQRVVHYSESDTDFDGETMHWRTWQTEGDDPCGLSEASGPMLPEPSYHVRGMDPDDALTMAQLRERLDLLSAVVRKLEEVQHGTA